MMANEETTREAGAGPALTLYIAGESAKSRRAAENLQRFCSECISGECTIEIIDIVLSPALAREENIFVVPTLVRTHPLPSKRIIGDLSNFDEVLEGLDLT